MCFSLVSFASIQNSPFENVFTAVVAIQLQQCEEIKCKRYEEPEKFYPY